MRSFSTRCVAVALLSVLVSSSCVRVRSGEDEQPRARGTDDDARAGARSGEPEAVVGEGTKGKSIEVEGPVQRQPAELLLSSAGDEPRMLLQLRPELGAREVVTLRMGMVVAMQVGSHEVAPQPIPSIEAKLATVVKAVDDEAIRYDVETLGAVAGEGTDGSPRVREAVQQAVESMRATRGTITTTRRGRITSLELEAPAEDDAGIAPALEGFRQAFNQMFAWLPDEPVGLGATWRAVSHFEQNGIEIQQVASYRLVRRDGERIELAFELEQRAVEVSEANAALPGGALEVEAHAANGSGRVVIDLRRVMPVEGDAKSAGATRSKVSFGGAPETVLMQLDFDLSLRSM